MAWTLPATFLFALPMVAWLLCKAVICAGDARRGIISGDKGYLIIDNVNNPHTAHIYSADNKLIKVLETPTQITGYEYQVFACQDAISKSLIEAPDMPHSETIRIMKLMDNLRKEWGVVYPNDKQML